MELVLPGLLRAAGDGYDWPAVAQGSLSQRPPLPPRHAAAGGAATRIVPLSPPAFQALMIEDTSPVIDFYPPDFEVDPNGKRNAWEAVVLIPFIDADRLLESVGAIDFATELTPAERARNRTGRQWVYKASAYPSSDEEFPAIRPSNVPPPSGRRRGSGRGGYRSGGGSRGGGVGGGGGGSGGNGAGYRSRDAVGGAGGNGASRGYSSAGAGVGRGGRSGGYSSAGVRGGAARGREAALRPPPTALGRAALRRSRPAGSRTTALVAAVVAAVARGRGGRGGRGGGPETAKAHRG
eukprot:TRINITY_DN8135_c0_g1_i1.p1 TRINITY_DN8135_c0_g1~~TRINITY_DN8135_c0_g1_i1.p1  ORF type:complete len:294 (+),score=66.16 TRINITY_DN8135_c0_g1_i1:413-1294(+)